MIKHRLDLGCGTNRFPGYLAVDKEPRFEPDVLADLEEFPWPFDDDSVAIARFHHSLEHMGQSTSVFLGIMCELYRVLAPDGRAFIVVPHPRSDGFLAGPTHVRPFLPASFALFSKRLCAEYRRDGWPNTQLATVLDVDFEIEKVEIELQPAWREAVQSGRITEDGARRMIESQFNVAAEIRIELRKVPRAA